MDGSYADFNLKAAVVIQLAASGNQCPDTPDAPEGATSCNVSHEYTYSTRTTDPNGNQVKYGWDWTSDGTVDEWTSFYSSGSIVNTSHTWTSPGTYNIQVKAMDVGDAMSDWSDVLTVNVIDNRPTPPSISGQTNGKINTEYIYSFDSSDPTEDDVSFYIEWGDGIITDWTEFYPPGTPGYSESHSWATKGTYTIRAKAIDINGDESDWGQLTVTMPFSYEPQFPFISWLLERFPNGFPLLRHLLGY